MPEFHLDAEAATYAELTGIAFGWTQEEPQRIVCACRYCGWTVEQLGEVPPDAPADYEEVATQRVWALGQQLALERRCPHLVSYEMYKREAPAGVGMLTLLRLAPSREP